MNTPTKDASMSDGRKALQSIGESMTGYKTALITRTRYNAITDLVASQDAEIARLREALEQTIKLIECQQIEFRNEIGKLEQPSELDDILFSKVAELILQGKAALGKDSL